MNITITADDLRSAPPEVRAWLASQLGLQVSPAAKPAPEPPAEPPAKPQAKPEAEPRETEQPTIEYLIQRATELVREKGSPDIVLAALEKLGIPRVSECPPDRIAEVLAELALHE